MFFFTGKIYFAASKMVSVADRVLLARKRELASRINVFPSRKKPSPSGQIKFLRRISWEPCQLGGEMRRKNRWHKVSLEKNPPLVWTPGLDGQANFTLLKQGI